jgi:hypothetical protein
MIRDETPDHPLESGDTGVVLHTMWADLRPCQHA